MFSLTDMGFFYNNGYSKIMKLYFIDYFIVFITITTVLYVLPFKYDKQQKAMERYNGNTKVAPCDTIH